MTTTTLTAVSGDAAKPRQLGQPHSTLSASFNYYSLETSPELDDISSFNGTSSDIASRTLPVTDLRGLSESLSRYNHETHGFQILHQPLAIDASHSSVHDPKIMYSEYYPSIVSLLKERLNVRSAVVINHTLRDVSVQEAHHVDPKNPRPVGKSLAPFFLAHSDYTPAAARAHLRAMTPEWFRGTKTEAGTTDEERKDFFRLRDEIIYAEDEAMRNSGLEAGNGDAISGKGGQWDWDGHGYDGPRYAMFSIWRPWETVKRDPLAVLDTQGHEFSYVSLPRMYRNRPGCIPEYYNENVLVKPPTLGGKGHHGWYYIKEQKPEEVLALKFYDSEALRRDDSKIRLMCPHSAFHTPEMDNEPVRRSCELRVWCIW
ncbi:putative GA4 desaturase [Seiridium cardinale]